MAQLPLNKFLTKTQKLGSTTSTVYTAPIGTTAIVLMAQVANLSTNTTHYVTFEHYRYRTVQPDAQGFGGQSGLTSSKLVSNFAIPPNDAGTPLTGKLIVEELDKVYAYADTTATMQLVMSILQTANS